MIRNGKEYHYVINFGVMVDEALDRTASDAANAPRVSPMFSFKKLKKGFWFLKKKSITTNNTTTTNTNTIINTNDECV